MAIQSHDPGFEVSLGGEVRALPTVTRNGPQGINSRAWLKDVPVLGGAFDKINRIHDGLQPHEDDSVGATVGKRAMQVGFIAIAAGGVMVATL
jgi:hypothetical protein